MYRRTLAGRWPYVAITCIALVAATIFSLWQWRGGAAAPPAQAVTSRAAAGTPTAEPNQGATLAAESPKALSTPTLFQVLQAADALAKAGKLPPPAPTPTLFEVLQAADALAKAGKLPPPAPTPTLFQVLQAADALAKAGELPGPPPLAPAEPPSPPTPAPRATAPTPLPAAPGGWSDANYEARALELINMQRAKFELAALVVDVRLERSSGDYAQVLGVHNWFSHTGPDGSTLVSRVEAAGFPFTVQIGEVLAWGNEGWTPEAMVQAWMNSPTHRAEILSPVYIRAGIGCYFTPENGATVHCVVDFAG